MDIEVKCWLVRTVLGLGVVEGRQYRDTVLRHTSCSLVWRFLGGNLSGQLWKRPNRNPSVSGGGILEVRSVEGLLRYGNTVSRVGTILGLLGGLGECRSKVILYSQTILSKSIFQLGYIILYSLHVLPSSRGTPVSLL